MGGRREGSIASLVALVKREACCILDASASTPLSSETTLGQSFPVDSKSMNSIKLTFLLAAILWQLSINARQFPKYFANWLFSWQIRYLHESMHSFGNLYDLLYEWTVSELFVVPARCCWSRLLPAATKCWWAVGVRDPQSRKFP